MAPAEGSGRAAAPIGVVDAEAVMNGLRANDRFAAARESARGPQRRWLLTGICPLPWNTGRSADMSGGRRKTPPLLLGVMAITVSSIASLVLCFP
jgi:hypothetical protein